MYMLVPVDMVIYMYRDVIYMIVYVQCTVDYM